MGYMARITMHGSFQSLRRISFSIRNDTSRWCGLACLVLYGIGAITASSAIETVTVDQDGAVFTVEGEIVVEAGDGGMILRDRQGKIWPL